MFSKGSILTAARWTARVVGTAILALIVTIGIGEGLPNPLVLSIRELLLFAAMLMMVVGLIAAWKWERIGGLLIVGGLAFFAVVNHGIQINLVFGPMLGVGLIYLGCGWRGGRMGWKHDYSHPERATGRMRG